MWARTAKRHLATRNAETCDQLLSVERIVGYIRWNLPLAIRHIAEHRSGRLIRLRMAQDYQKRTYQGSHQELRFMPKLRKSQMTGTEVELIISLVCKLSGEDISDDDSGDSTFSDSSGEWTLSIPSTWQRGSRGSDATIFGSRR